MAVTGGFSGGGVGVIPNRGVHGVATGEFVVHGERMKSRGCVGSQTASAGREALVFGGL